MNRFLWILYILLFVGCSENPKPPHSWTLISGREGTPLYRIKAPNSWNCTHTDSKLLADTMKALCEFNIIEEDQTIRITIHNFPSNSINERIPPMAQIARWKRQFEELNPTHTLITPQSYCGFLGHYFEGTGRIKGNDITMMGWALQIAPEHYSTLSYSTAGFSQSECKQMRSDVTIKVIGSPDMIQKYKRQIKQFAKSFELIEEIPVRS